MTDRLNALWSRHLDSIADELLRLSIACDVRLKDEGVVERILKNDQSVCGRKNELAFGKLQKLIAATFDSLGKAIDRIGPEETRQITKAITERVERRRPPRPQVLTGAATSHEAGVF